jgi:DNA-binding NarL/FixJ family response regulator
MEMVGTSRQSRLTAPLGRLASTSISEIDQQTDRSATGPNGAILDVAILDDRPLIRDCLGRSLQALDPGLKLTYLSHVEEFGEAYIEQAGRPRVLVINMNSLHGIEAVVPEISRVKGLAPETMVIVLSETERVGDILLLFESGASGYIPPSIGLEVAVKALQLVAAGGLYVPACILSGYGDPAKHQGQDPAGNKFTSKQMAVIDALRRGKANKLIAYELNMCESTVKVHVRNVMKKLRAKNRTEAALILNDKLHEGLRTRTELRS